MIAKAENQSDAILQQRISDFLEGSRLSLNQIADKWEISPPMLSQVKNGRRKCGIDMALKILRETGSDVGSRRDWLEQRYFEESKEASVIFESIQKDKKEKHLKEAFSQKLASHPTMTDIFLDIVLAEESGVNWNTIFQQYGDSGIQIASSFIDLGLVRYLEGRYVVVEANVVHVLDPANSFRLLEGIIQRMKDRAITKVGAYDMDYEIADVTEDGYKKLKELHLKFTEEARKIVNENSKHSLKGGIRVITQNLLGPLKALLLVSLLGLGLIDSSFAGGLRGGGHQDGRPSLGARYLWGYYELHNLEVQGATRDEALRNAEMMLMSFSQGRVPDRNIIHAIMRNGPRDTINSTRACKKMTFENATEEQFRRGHFRPGRFHLNDGLYSVQNGRSVPIYSIDVGFEFPCER